MDSGTLEKLRSILADPNSAAQRAADLEREPANLPDGYVSPLVGDPAGIQWFRARRALSFFVWDIYAAAAINHYRAENPGAAAPLLKASGIVVDTLPDKFVDSIERAFLRCREVPWRDERPDGYTFDPFPDPCYTPEFRDSQATHREMSSELGGLLNEALLEIAPRIEAILGCHWAAGGVRLFSQKAKTEQNVGFHSDLWPLSLHKLMIYPSGAGPDLGSTVFKLKNGKPMLIVGGKGVWTIFENTTLHHGALAPKLPSGSRPTIEITILPALRTDPKIKTHGINVGYPWLPPDIEGLEGELAPAGLSTQEIKERSLLRTLLLALDMPSEIKRTPIASGLGYLDA